MSIFPRIRVFAWPLQAALAIASASLLPGPTSSCAAVYQIIIGNGDQITLPDGTASTGRIEVGWYADGFDFSGKDAATLYSSFNKVAPTGGDFTYDPLTSTIDRTLNSNGPHTGRIGYLWVFDQSFNGSNFESSAYGLFNAANGFVDVNDIFFSDSIFVLDDTANGMQAIVGSIIGDSTPGDDPVEFRLAGVVGPSNAVIGFSYDAAPVNEDAGTVPLTIQRTGVLDTEVTVQVETVAGTATAPLDFTAISPPTVVTFLANDTEETVSVTVVNRPGFQGSRQFAVRLLNPGTGAQLGATTESTVTINDTEPAAVEVSALTPFATTEAGDGSPKTFTVALSRPPVGTVTVPISSDDTTEGTVSTAQLDFTPSNWNTPQQVTVTGVDDFVVDGDINYNVVVGVPTAANPADAGFTALAAQNLAAVNADDDTAGGTLVGAGMTTEAGATVNLTLVLEAQPTADVVIAVTSSDTTEGAVTTGAQLTFTPSNWNTPQEIVVTGVDDFIDDGDQNYNLTFAVTSADSVWNGLSIPAKALVNQDDDTAGYTVVPTSGLVVSEDGTTAQFTVLLTSEPSAGQVVVSVVSSDPSEGIVSPSQLVFLPGNWNVAQAVTVTGVNDDLADGPQQFTVDMATAPATTAPEFSGLPVPSVGVTNNDNDTPGVTVNPTGGLVTTEAGGQANFTVRLNTQPAADVSISLTSSDLTEGTVSPSLVTFTTLNWNQPQVVTVTGVDDFVDDGDIAYTVITGATTSSDAGYNGLVVPDVALTNLDDDTAGFTVVPTSGLVTTEAGGTASFTVVLNSEPTANVSIASVSGTPGEAVVGSGSPAVFTASNWNIPQTVGVVGVNDFIADGNRPFTISVTPSSTDPLYNALAARTVTGTNLDDDAVGFVFSKTSGLMTTEAGGQDTFTVKLRSQPTGTLVMTMNVNPSTEASVSPTSLNFDPSNWNTEQVVTVTGLNDFYVDGPQPFTVVTPVITTGTDTTGYIGWNPPDVTGTNADNDVAGVTITPLVLTTTEAAGAQQTATFTVQLSARPRSQVSFAVTSGDLTEGTVSPAAAIFNDNAQWADPVTITVTGVDDFVVDGDVTYDVTVAPSVSGDAPFNGLPGATVKVTNLDNDVPAEANLGGSFFAVNEGSSVTIPVRLAAHPGGGVPIQVSCRTVNGSAAAPGDFTAVNRVLTFTANGTQNVVINTVNDTDPENDEVFYFELLPPPPGSPFILVSPSTATIQINRNSEGLDQPDLLVAQTGNGSGVFAGDNVYNTSGNNQIVFSAGNSRGSSGTFRFRVQNDGPVTDGIRLVGAKTFTRTVSYQVQNITEADSKATITVTHNGKNVTADIFGPGYLLANRASGKETTLEVTIKTSGSTPKGTNIGVTLTGTSTNTTTKTDRCGCLFSIAP